MDNIVNFGDFKEKKKEKQSDSLKNDSTYFIMLGNENTGTTKFRFGGAFVRDFVQRIKDVKDEIKEQVSLSYNVMLHKVKEENNPKEYVNVYLGRHTLFGIIDLLDNYTFDALFDDEKLASQAGMVMGIVIFSYYNYETLETMQNDNWIDCDLTLIKKMYDQINNTTEE